MATTTNTETGVANDHGASDVFPPFDSSTFASQLLWLAITFGLFYYLMSRVALPRISSILEERSDRIAEDLAEAGRLRDASNEALAAYEQELAEAKSNAHGIAQDARDKAKAEMDAQRAKVEATLADKITDAEERIARIKAEAMAEVDTIATDTTETLVKELTGSTVTKSAVKQALTSAS